MAQRRSAAVLLLALLLSNAWLSAQVSDAAYQLKAAFVSKFAEFAEWPADALDDTTTLDLCYVGPPDLGRMLSELVAGETRQGRSIVARPLGNDDVTGCQLLYVPGPSTVEAQRLLARTGSLPVLTVGDSPTFLDQGGIVNLLVVGGRVRFEINVGAANKVGIRLSSQLLRLAMNVRGSE